MTARIILFLAAKSLLNRWLTAGLTVFAIAVSVMMVLSVEKIRTDAKLSFANTISGTDLVVGARSGAVQLLLYSVFRIGNATNNISWRSYQEIANRNDLKWSVPLSLGDSHRGYRVMGTTDDYFKHYRYGARRVLQFDDGIPFDDIFDTVLGAEVAEALDYAVGDKIVIAHGLGRAGFTKHVDKPFTVTGILKRTGTPLDRTVHVSLNGIEAIHLDWRGGSRIPGRTITADQARELTLTPRSVTAVLLGLKSRLGAFRALREINESRREPLLAILPGVALQELWSLMGTAEAALGIVVLFVVAAGLIGMATMLLASLNERRREMAILRAVGARPAHVFAMFVLEGWLLTLLACVLGIALLYFGLAVAQPLIETRFGLYVPLDVLTIRQWIIISAIMGAGTVTGAVPAWFAYRNSIADGMTIRT
ncbi:MAG: FtsX-like permease family protein [Alphaproteobacteria bacterium]|nr:FtsX-like permease family protein [Alphaproteobacteria bacterium]